MLWMCAVCPQRLTKKCKEDADEEEENEEEN